MLISWSKRLLIGLGMLSLGCAALQEMMAKPQVTGVDPKITGADLEGVDLTFDVKVQNPYPTAIQASKLRYRMEIEGAELASSETDAAISVPANSEGTVSLPMRVAFRDVLRVYKSGADKPEVGYKLSGTAVVSAFGKPVELPVSHSGKIPIVRPPRFSDVKVGMARDGFTSATINVSAKVTNPNAFELGVDGLAYMLKLGDAEIGRVSATSGGTLKPGETKPFALKGHVSGAQALRQLMQAGKLGKARLETSGSFKTPYGPVKP